ncbi:hypothetical protein SAMD00019534_095080 [Acytostelium subglobosum LB1]|uniref:hypothetical protein n=1 Tax=Acytostelium subglobosum LB1 TaxID=1410327 RepID=UPI000644E3DE|nr:hypothetical protein SAMD00019534_095080 [Acytostelium subglobosum LB1]GAM26333.1 hypothetical protein SAMD00019534_095080 [Acytostelium subglobosum LB1]|eukprot:XP_012750887.1 hypothetical protein SAMD00019534_095080 [Acytostelium subglobosum LB1]
MFKKSDQPSKDKSATAAPPTPTSTTTPTKVDLKKEKKEKEKDEKREKDREKIERKEKERQDRRAAKEARALAKLEKKQASKDRKGGRERSNSDLSVDDTDTDDTDSISDLSSSLDRTGPLGLGGSLTTSTGRAEAAASGKELNINLSVSNKAANQSSSESAAAASRLYMDGEAFSSENFLIALTDTDHLGPAIKSVFELGKQNDVIDSLNEYIGNKERDIEKICGDNHEGFINSVTSFLSLKQDNLALKQSVIHLNYEIQEIGGRYVTKAEEMLACKRTKDNIRKTKEILNNCQYAIQLGMKIEEYVKNKRYYHAIKHMDQLHNVYLKRLADFQFARNMDANIPIIKENIKKLVKDEFNTWMVDIKERSAKIGRFGMIQSAKRLEKEREINPLKMRTSFGESEAVWDRILGLPSKDNTSAIGLLSPNQQIGSPSFVSYSDIEKDDLIMRSPFDEVNIDFHPLYQCLFIYSSLGLMEEFQGYYTLNRMLQFQMVIQPKEHGQVWESFLQQIAGYFMVESMVIDTTHPHLSKTAINECWNTALVKITSVLQELFTHCHDTRSLISFKKFVLVFTNTLSLYGYHVQPLLYMLDTMKEKYCQFAIVEGVEMFTKILESESNVTLYVETPEEYRNLILANNLDPDFGKSTSTDNSDDNDEQQQTPAVDDESLAKMLPKAFPFSKLVPQFYTLLKRFISEFYEFTSQLSENEDFIIRSTDTLIRKINDTLYNFLTMSSAVPQVIQLVVNLKHLLVACQFFKDYLNSLILGDNKTADVNLTSSNRVALSSSNLLYTTKGLGEKHIIALCERKIDDLMSSSANINWSPVASDDRPRDYIEDVVTYLEFTLPFVQPLSPQLREDFITKAFKRISELLTTMIHSDSLKKFNMSGVKCFNADLKQIEEFARRKADEKERTATSSRDLVGSFYELRQTVNLLLAENPEEFGDIKIRAKHYNLITNIHDLIILFQKYKEESKGFTTPKEQKDRNNKIANAIKKFKEMV